MKAIFVVILRNLSPLDQRRFPFWSLHSFDSNMGQKTWYFQTCTPSLTTRIFCLSTIGSSCLQLIGANQWIKLQVEAAIQEYYLGRHAFNQTVNCHQWQLTPWAASDIFASIKTRRFMLSLIRQLRNEGYCFYANVDFNSSSQNLFFIKDKPAAVHPGVTRSSHQFCMITLDGFNRMWLIDCKPEVISATRQALENFWRAPGIANEWRCADSCLEIALNGSPWRESSQYATASQALMTYIFDDLSKLGWLLECIFYTGIGPHRKPVFIIRHQIPPVALSYFALISELNRIRLINGPQKIALLMQQFCASFWSGGIDFSKDVEEEIRLCQPHLIRGVSCSFNSNEDKAMPRTSLCRLLDELRNNGCAVIGTANLTNQITDELQANEYRRLNHENGCNTETIFCSYNVKEDCSLKKAEE